MDGAVDVDPAEYAEKLLLVFNEPLVEVEVLSTRPEFPFTAELIQNVDILETKSLEIKFLDYTMPRGKMFIIAVKAMDLAGNSAQLEYSFATIARENG